MIEGKWVVHQGKSTVYDEDEIFGKGKTELIDLLKRSKIS